MAPRSLIWKYFTKISKEHSQCNICLRNLKTSGNTSNLSNHLKQKHNDLYKQLFSNSEDPTPEKKIKTVDVSSNIVIDETDTSESETFDAKAKPGGSVLRQPKITHAIRGVSSFSDGGAKNVRITDAIVQFIIQDNMPFTTVEGRGFVNLLKETAPLYKVPTRNTVKERIDKKYDIMSTAFKAILKNVRYFTVTTDIWTADMQTKSFMGVTVHFVKDMEICSVTLGVSELTESHTAAYITSQLSKILEDWEYDIDNVVAIVTDNGANMVKAIHDLVGKARHVPCFAHTINLLCENSIKQTPNLIVLIEKVRAIVVWCKRSVRASDELRRLQKNMGTLEGNTLKLILDVKTRWNSTYFMISRFLKLAPLLGNILLSNVNAPNMISATELEELKQVCQLLYPLEQTTKEMSGQNYVTLSKVIPIIGCLVSQYETFKPNSDIAKDLKTAILKEFEKRFSSVEKCFLLAASTILDPRFKNIHFKDPIALSNVIRHLKNEMSAEARDREQSSSSDLSDQPDKEEHTFDLWAYHKTIAHAKKNKKTGEKFDELSQYLSVPVRNLKENTFEIWDEMKTVYPELYTISQKYFSVVATSVPSERLFSKAGATSTKNRNRLTGKRLSKLLFLGSLPEKIFLR